MPGTHPCKFWQGRSRFCQTALSLDICGNYKFATFLKIPDLREGGETLGFGPNFFRQDSAGPRQPRKPNARIPLHSNSIFRAKRLALPMTCLAYGSPHLQAISCRESGLSDVDVSPSPPPRGVAIDSPWEMKIL